MPELIARVVYWSHYRSDVNRKTGFGDDVPYYSCWVYSNDDNAFVEWMNQHMTGKYQTTRKYNSGTPMIIVVIQSDIDAAIFKLCWNVV